MDNIRITRRFVFDMAHALWEYDGPCRNIHGHSYKLFVTLLGKPKTHKGHPKDGMVYDFSDLKKMVDQYILSEFDHALVLSEQENTHLVETLSKRYERIVIFPVQPSCENLLLHFRDILQKQLPVHLKLIALRLDETINSYAEWKLEDQGVH
ncbi:MAG: 6-carboxytetrahydropterin synthase [Saprospiraceae bacterium]|nr:6-carboxytetrahydropterin synthase [Saprospiraceae bacterium]